MTEIVSDNGRLLLVALRELEHKYHSKHIRISGYNSWANGIVECSHFNVWQALFKVANGDQNHWSQVAH